MTLGGDALIRAGERGTAQQRHATADRIGAAVAAGWRFVALGLADHHGTRIMSGSARPC